MVRTILLAAALLGLAGAAHACNVPNPNLLGPPYVDNCPVPASTLNKLMLPVVTNVALKAVPTSAMAAGTSLLRAGFTLAGDGGAAAYTFSTSACSLNSGNGDNGSQVKPTTGGGCWLVNFAITSPNLLQFGADPTGAVDSGPAFQAAYNATAGVADCVFVPAGTYLLNSQVSITGGMPCFRGVKPNTAQGGGTKTGTWLHITSISVQPFLISGSSVSGKGGFFDFGVYNDQPAIGVGWAPLAYQYPFVVTNQAQDLEFRRIEFYNTTHCISFSNTGRVVVDDISGQPMGTCLTYDLVQDVPYLDHIHLWPFASNDANTLKYTQQSVDVIEMFRVDTPMIGRIFTLGYHSTIHFGSSVNGVTTGFQISDLQSDLSTYGVWITGNNVAGHIANFRAASGKYDLSNAFAAGSEGYRDEGNFTDVMIANFQSFSSNESAIHLLASGHLSIGNAEIWQCNGANDSSSPVKIDLGGTAPGIVAINNLPSISGTLCASTPFVNAVSGAWAAVPAARQNWGPTIVGSTSGSASSYSVIVGQFWFNGSRMHVEFNLNAAVASGLVGNVLIAGLPLPAIPLTNGLGSCVISETAGIVVGGGYSSITGAIAQSANKIQLIKNGAAVSSTPVVGADIPAGASISGACDYSVN